MGRNSLEYGVSKLSMHWSLNTDEKAIGTTHLGMPFWTRSSVLGSIVRLTTN